MLKHSRALVVISTLLLLLRTLLPQVNGQGTPPEWNSRSDSESAPDGGSLTSSPNARQDRLYWPSNVDGSSSGFSRDMVEPNPMLRNPGLQQPTDIYLLTKGQRHPRRLNAEDVNPFRNLQNKKLSQFPVGSTLDLPLDDLPQQIQPGFYSEETISTPTRTRIKPRQAGLSRFYLFSNLKRNIARDGYMCHFKLCQVGVSGKRLSSM